MKGNDIRLRYGLRWRGGGPGWFDLSGRTREITFTTVIILLLAVITSGATFVVVAHVEAREAEQTLIDCMNGKAFWTSEDGVKVGCMPAEENPA